MIAIPRISCIMPTTTSARRDFVTQAITLFAAQDYPNKELIILDSGRLPRPVYVSDCDRHWLTYTYIASERHVSIGAKRNLAASLATGDIVCHWDDDDYYAPNRLSKQVEPILQGRADVTALQMRALLDAPTKTLYACADETHRALFVHDVRSGTLMYHRGFLDAGLCYPNRSTGEDVAMLKQLLAHHAQLERVTEPCYVCVRHSTNISDGLQYGEGWTPVALSDYIPAHYHSFYTQFATRAD